MGQKQQSPNEKIKTILQKVKIELAVDLGKVSPKSIVKTKTDKLWKQVYDEEKKLKQFPIYNEIEKKQLLTDHGDYISPIKFTPKEQEFLNTNPYQLKIEQIIKDIQHIEEQEKQNLKQRLFNGTATKKEQEQLENAEFKIWDSGKELLGINKGSKLPAFTVDSDFQSVFNDEDGYYKILNQKVDCQLRQELNQLGYDYEDTSKMDKIIYPIDKKQSKTEFLKENRYCKKYIK